MKGKREEDWGREGNLSPERFPSLPQTPSLPSQDFHLYRIPDDVFSTPGRQCFHAANLPRGEIQTEGPVAVYDVMNRNRTFLLFLQGRSLPSTSLPRLSAHGESEGRDSIRSKVLGGREGGVWGWGEGTFLKKGSLSPSPIFTPHPAPRTTHRRCCNSGRERRRKARPSPEGA